jgi:hypothetical protein
MGVSTHFEREPSRVRNKQFVFIVGSGRSGTTATGMLFGNHGQIVMGLERYIRLPSELQFAEWGEEVFSKEHFFGSSMPPSSNRQYYRMQEEKFDSATWVGDKVPSWIINFHELRARYPDSVVYYVMRDPAAVGLSWQARAEKAVSGFWKGKHFGNGVMSCVNNFKRAVALVEAGTPRFHILEYERLFPYDLNYIAAALAPLGLEPDDAIKAFCEGERTTSARVVGKSRPLTEDQLKFLRERVDLGVIQVLREAALKP